MRRSLSMVGWLGVLLALAPLPGCALLGIGAAGAAAGAAGGVYLTDNGASSLVQAPLEEVAARTRTAFQEMRIELVGEETHEAGNDLEFKGENGSLDITVDLERQGPRTTLVEVSARENAVRWNRDYAKLVLERIAQSR